MYNLLVSGAGWNGSHDSLSISRVLEYTEDPIKDRLSEANGVDFRELQKYPCIFMEEIDPMNDAQIAHVGYINNFNINGSDVLIDYTYDNAIPVLTNSIIKDLAQELGIVTARGVDEFSRTHWSVKDINLFRVLLRNLQPRRTLPKVFTLSNPEKIESSLVSFMMPFNLEFQNVYTQVSSSLEELGLRCRRADNIWENPAIIQDIVSLIDHSNIIICDCTGKNPNVFYEIGIAHTLGREVILITQNMGDIPFDLRHLRTITYQNNGEGLRELSGVITDRAQVLLGL